MMAKKYSLTERQEALKLADEIGAAAAARRLGMNVDTLYGWRNRTGRTKQAQVITRKAVAKSWSSG